MIRALIATALVAVPLTGCTIPVKLAYAEVCRPDAVMAYVGQPYTPRIGRIIKDKTQSFRLRTVTPGMVVTQEFDAKRVTVTIDERDRVSRISCG